MLAVVGIGAMIAFVFLQPMMSYMDNSRAPQDPVVVETKYGDYKESRLAGVRQSRELVQRFFEGVVAATVDAQIKQGFVDPRMRDSMFQRLFGQVHAALLQRSNPGPESSALETLILAKRAEELGMVVSDRAINDLLIEVTNDLLSSADLQAIINNLQQGRRVSTARLFDAIRTEMLAANLLQLFQWSLIDIPPAQKFEYYSRVNRRADAQIMPLAVADFTSQIEAPDETVLKAFFEKYKNDLPDPASPEPGFKVPRMAAFQYFKADFAKFTDEAKEEVTDEEIAEYYEKNKAQFVQLDLPDDPEDEPKDDASKDDMPDDTPAPDESDPSDDKPTSNEESTQPEEAPDKPTEGQPDSADKPEPSDEAPKANGEDAKTDDGPQEASDDDSADGPTVNTDEPGDQEAKKDSAARQPASRGFHLTSNATLIQDEAATQEAPADEDADTTQPEPADEPAPESAEKGAASTEADAPADESPKDEPTTEPDKTPNSDEPAKSASDSADDKSPEPDTEASAGEVAETSPQPEQRYEPLEKVQDQIRDTLASQKAAARITEIFDELQGEMRRYADEREIYETRRGTEANLQPPKPFPFAELAKKHDIVAKELPLVSAADAAAEDIGKVSRITQDRRSQFGFRQEPFVEFAFRPSLPDYRPDVVSDNEGNSYLFWKTQQKESYVPTFDQVREKVLAAWKMIEARPLARKRAEELAAQARAAVKPLADVFEGDEGLQVLNAKSFSWMTTGAVPFNPQGGPVRISEIEGVSYPGDEFMKTIFDLPVGGVGVTTNEPQDTMYVVQLEDYEQTLEQLRDSFATEPPARYLAVAQPERSEMFAAWIDGLEKDADVRWVRSPDVARNQSSGSSEL